MRLLAHLLQSSNHVTRFPCSFLSLLSFLLLPFLSCTPVLTPAPLSALFIVLRKVTAEMTSRVPSSHLSDPFERSKLSCVFWWASPLGAYVRLSDACAALLDLRGLSRDTAPRLVTSPERVERLFKGSNTCGNACFLLTKELFVLIPLSSLEGVLSNSHCPSGQLAYNRCSVRVY